MTADDTSAISSGQSYPARPCCSLRGTITVVTVAAVVAVAALTLSIALVPSFNALEDIANNGALAVLADAQDQTRDFFNAPIDAANALRNFTYRQAWQPPSLDSTVAQTYMDYIVAVTRPGRLTAAVWFTDNTRILSIFDQLVTGDSISQVQLGLPTPDQQNYTVVTTASFEQNLTMMSPALVGRLLDQGVLAAFPYSFVHAGPLWAGLLRPCANGTSPFFLGIQAKADYHGRGTTLSVTYVVPLRQKNDQAGNPFAVCVLTLSVAAINAFLAKATFPGATILAYTSLGTLIASSDNDRVPTAQTHFQASSRDSVPSNCMTDDTFTPANAQPSNGTWYMCVMQLSDYPEEGVSSAATQDFAFSSAPTVVRLTAGGVVYIMASAPVPIQYPGASVHLLVTIKESIITGNVVDARNIAISVTAAAIVVIAIASFFLVTVLLKPLTTVAARMELAARLDTDVEAMVPSSMSEVRALQNSFDAMSTELARIRSFVPHSVTAQAAHEDVPCDLLYDAEVESTCTASDYSRSQRERSVGSKNAAAANTFLTSRQLNIALGLTSSSIAVVVANCEGFLPKVLAASRDDATTSIANLVHWLVDTVNAHGGVLSSFHGDHFVATFNAAKSCTQSSRRAVAVALAIANRDPLPSVVDCPMTVGVASGRCLVGNVGCVGAMNFAAIGAPYTQATILQRLNRYYDTTVLSTHRTMRNVDTWFKTHVLDIINMPTDTHHRRTVLIGSILEPNERPHDGDVEGFYIVSEDGAEDAEARREEVFEHLVKGRYQQALSAYDRLVSRWQRTGCQVNDKTLERLVASARALLTTDAPQTQIFTDLGAYYSLCICRPPRSSESTSDS